MAKIKNNFNDLGPKKWLPFQKSFTIFDTTESLIEENINFFIKLSSSPKPCIKGMGSPYFIEYFESYTEEMNLNNPDCSDSLDFLALDLTNITNSNKTTLEIICKQALKLNYRKFLWILLPTEKMGEDGFPTTWKISNQLSGFLTRKDEKIICLPNGKTMTSLYFRKDEFSKLKHFKENLNISSVRLKTSIPNWFILKPKPRSKEEILHPAKYPEELVRMYVKEFTNKEDTIFDPMSGTGTTQVESLIMGRQAYGIELSKLFHGIATKRCDEISTSQKHSIFLGDARNISNFDIPPIDYIITSPPYWDMLNMKGAEVQANRKAKGLQTNYSDNIKDLGNLDDYNEFLNVLIEIYKETTKKLKSNSHFTIIVKNIKKKGNHYPLAFDLTERLNKFLKLKHIGFWCQNDLQISPYGYKHTWVSNTFHHYCLTFIKI
ncbi:MAG: hypothetical protein HOB40_06715 [Candidatus Marinimicrobia bacterium]|jgi:DNA modification methylase|nr:hypothetical protein [Candidatus Neomarinimicrobiota bacterium]MBT3501346.1 hypothetical protein [Candidatus Neomarinimicrobiota bacterium]MBT3839082.1 hypothetical protein [Candidatus Neomarinimicrobiota bacterium]MBT4000205.1 hypothetical protein [Candidatus Neomarinimicrobiota bacterium]MBT4283574.1 hypothetical protein [Candidatus Neomarinimicrobiota bacterium]